jgi:hypothetical protein
MGNSIFLSWGTCLFVPIYVLRAIFTDTLLKHNAKLKSTGSVLVFGIVIELYRQGEDFFFFCDRQGEDLGQS